MLRSALEINCKSPVRTLLAILRNPLWSSSAVNCSPVATNDVRDKEQQLLDTWLCESIFFKACPQSCGQAVTLNRTFVWAHFWGIWALCILLGWSNLFFPEICAWSIAEREAESRLFLTVSHWAHPGLLWAFVPSSVLELHSASFSAFQTNWFYWDSLLVRNLCRVAACCLNQSEGGVASILPVHFSLLGTSCSSLHLAEIEHLSSDQPSCGQGAQGSSLWVIQEKML